MKGKKEMAYLGYYNVTDFAALKGLSKQYISKASDKFESLEREGRRWYKFDNGQHAISIYGAENPSFDKFCDFGFKKRTKSLAINDAAICDVKRLNSESLSIRFYNNNGDMLCAYVSLKDVEIIENDGQA